MQNDFRFEIYRYEPLPREDCFRMLRQVKEGRARRMFEVELLQFTLEVVDIESDIEFEALSYTWGNPKISETGETSSAEESIRCFPILVNEKLLFVTSNLFDALHRLCEETQTENLIDDMLPPWNKSKLIMEAEAGNVGEVAKLLLQGADIDIQDLFGNTALHYAAENGFLETVQVLLDAGADLDLKTHDGRTPLDCCRQANRRQYYEVEALLLAYQKPGIVKRGTFKPSLREKIEYKWVDAICIDQENLEERNSQVSQIQKIYQQAARVAIWLGEIGNEDDWQVAYPKPFDLNWFRYNLEIISYHQCAWFRRVWTVQEAALASDIRMLFGPHELSLLDPLTVPKPTHATAILNRPVDSKLSAGMILWAESNPRSIVQGPKTNESAVPDDEDTQIHAHSWTSILAMTFNLEATDPRDKIFALRGLVTAPGSLHVSVDYSCDVANLYLTVGRSFIVDGPNGDLDSKIQHDQAVSRPRRYAEIFDGLGYNQKILHKEERHLVSEERHDTIDLDLPSWCPDFRVPTRAALVDYLTFYASAVTRPVIYDSESYELKLDAKILDTIVKVVPFKMPDNENLSGKAFQQKVMLIFTEILSYLATKHPQKYATSQVRVIALIKTLTMSPYDDKNIFRPEEEMDLGQAFTTNEELALLLWLSDLLTGHDSIHNYHLDSATTAELSGLLSVRLAIDPLLRLSRLNSVELMDDVLYDLHQEHFLRRQGRALFITNTGYLGLGLISTMMGDRVVLFKGGHVFYILRLEDGSDAYSYVGDAYVYGAMYGEACQDNERFDPILIS